MTITIQRTFTMLCKLTSFMSTQHKLESFWKRETSVEKMSLPDWLVGKPVVHFLIRDWGNVRLTLGRATLGLVVLEAIIK